MTTEQEGWGKFGQEVAHAFLQWKGTDACMDFICECGQQVHWDGFFAYALRCPTCKAVWEMPYILYPRRNDDYDGNIQDPDVVEEYR